jgi:phosphate uptake regulator
MLTFDGIEENFVFMVIETQKQVSSTLELLITPDNEVVDKFLSRDDYIDNLKTIIENQCYSRINTELNANKGSINTIRAIHTVSVNLERIADNCVNIIRQFDYLNSPELLKSFDYARMFDKLIDGLSHIIPVFDNRDLSGALEICKTENELDHLYRALYDKIITELRTGSNTEDLVTLLFIFRYLERMGDTLLNIGEALIFAIIGERIKINQFLSMKQTLEQTGFDGDIADISFQSILGTRSGCRIGHVEHPDSNILRQQEGIFKEGNREKIIAEKANLERWADIMPGLSPRVFSFSETSSGASILIEFLHGRTLDEVIFSDSSHDLIRAVDRFTETLLTSWLKTKKNEPKQTGYMKQLRERLDRVLKVHPDFLRASMHIGDKPVISTLELLDKCEQIEAKISAPVTVFIHGDLNVNNILYNPAEDRIHFVDLYRSTETDYIQDVSVFLVSNFRLPVFDHPLRSRLDFVIKRTLEVTRSVAEDWLDTTFEARMALALARSYFTSTRFELNRVFAKQMLLRSHYLLELVVRHASNEPALTQFKLPEHILEY